MRITLESERKPFLLTLHGRGAKHNLEILEPVDFGRGAPVEAQDLVRTMMLAHLIGQQLPAVIETNFAIGQVQILTGLYEHYGRPSPRIRKAKGQIAPRHINGGDNEAGKIDVASAVSGGADSAYRVTRLIAEGEKPLGIHLQNLNKAPLGEAVASHRQCETWGIPHINVKLRNSSASFGYQTMATRDLLIGSVCAVVCEPYQSRRVLIEGGLIDDPQQCEYSECIGAWKLFNRTLKDVGLKTQVEGVDPGDIETIGELVALERKTGMAILGLVQNCFSAPNQLHNNRRKWERQTPKLAEASPPQWCGSCHKCRRMTLGRLSYQDPAMDSVLRGEKEFFVTDTYAWIKNYPQNAERLSESFLAHLKNLETVL